jgi:hypothetical protein
VVVFEADAAKVKLLWKPHWPADRTGHRVVRTKQAQQGLFFYGCRQLLGDIQL